MKQFTIQEVRQAQGWVCVVYGADDDPSDLRETQYRPERLSTFMAEYGLDDPAEAVVLVLHGPHVEAWVGSLAPADDPAVAAGWVTGTDSDAEPVHLFNARSTSDAREAYRCRVAAMRGTAETIADPLRLLARVPAHDPDKVRSYREVVDLARWSAIYGGFPEPSSDTRTPALIRERSGHA